jgi:hypothetical protein
MEPNQIFILCLTILLVVALVIFLVRKNNRDRKAINPDEPDVMKEMRVDKERKRDEM